MTMRCTYCGKMPVIGVGPCIPGKGHWHNFRRVIHGPERPPTGVAAGGAEMTSAPEEPGTALRRIRLDEGRSMRTTAERLGVSHVTLHEWETLMRPIPRLRHPAVVRVFPEMRPILNAWTLWKLRRCKMCGRELPT